jgi:uncharacterized membrane-anchored protein
VCPRQAGRPQEELSVFLTMAAAAARGKLAVQGEKQQAKLQRCMGRAMFLAAETGSKEVVEALLAVLKAVPEARAGAK